MNRVADPLATLGFLTPPNVLVTPWRDDYFETDASFGDLDSGNYSAYCAFEEKTFKVQVVKTGTGTGTVTVNPTGGTSCGVDCLRYPENTQIGLVAVPSSDSTMAGWSGCDAVFDLVSDKDCTVTFNLKPPPSASSCTTENVCIDSFRALLVATLSQYGTTVIDDTGYLTVTLEDGTIISAFLTRIVKDGDPAPGSVVTWPEVVTRTYSASYVPDQYDPLETVFLAASPTDAEITPLSDMDGNGLVDYEVRVNGTPDYVGMMYITSVH